MSDKRNVIESTSTRNCTKRDLLDLINNNFPDELTGVFGAVAVILTTEMTDGTISQTITFGRRLV